MAKEDTVRTTWGLSSSVSQPSFIAGVELEIEDIREIPDTCWSIEEDGSLRNSGREFISPPMCRDNLVVGFKDIHAGIRYKTNTPFTERTSIHVHVNCLDQTQEQVKSILMYYALFEPVFFSLVDPIRRNNIHCVGLDQTTLCEGYRRSLTSLVEKWSKYTALNLLPLSTQGTIEFRHMEGHSNANRFNAWLATLENLWTYGKENILKKDMLEDDDVLNAFDAIFKDSKEARDQRAQVLDMCADNLLDVKLSLL